MYFYITEDISSFWLLFLSQFRSFSFRCLVWAYCMQVVHFIYPHTQDEYLSIMAKNTAFNLDKNWEEKNLISGGWICGKF